MAAAGLTRADFDAALELLWQCKLPEKSVTSRILQKAADDLRILPSVIEVRSPVTICGDIHGQFYDVMELFSIAGRPPEVTFLFLGDYVDRGYFGTETFLLLLTMRCRWPRHVWLLRGNHESRQITEDYGFKEECVNKYDGDIYNAFVELFNTLPLAAVVDGSVFCVHGGLSPELTTVDDIQKVDRFQEPPERGLMADLLWSDPEVDIEGFQASQRGAGYQFGRGPVEDFVKRNNFKFVIRAHQQVEGFQKLFDGLLYTLWSAPNYVYRGGNVASVCEFENGEPVFKTFREAPISVRGKLPEHEIPLYFA